MGEPARGLRMSGTSATQIRLWGVRGSVPTPEASKLRYGGNTACVEVRLPGGELLVLDAGTGIRALGDALLSDPALHGRPIHLLLTHFHWDHIEGLPFFAPLYQPERRIHFHGPAGKHGLAASNTGTRRWTARCGSTRRAPIS